jgi:hypothetical protein
VIRNETFSIIKRGGNQGDKKKKKRALVREEEGAQKWMAITKQKVRMAKHKFELSKTTKHERYRKRSGPRGLPACRLGAFVGHGRLFLFLFFFFHFFFIAIFFSCLLVTRGQKQHMWADRGHVGR